MLNSAISFAESLPFLDLDTIEDHEILLDSLPQAFMEKNHVLVLTKQRIIISNQTQHDSLQQIYFYLGQAGSLWQTHPQKLENRINALLQQYERNHLINDDEASVVQYVEKLIHHAVLKKASDIHLESTEKHFVIRFRIDGLLYEIEKLARHFSSRIINHLKVLAQLDTTEKRQPQDGRLRFHFLSGESHIDCRISTCPTLHEEKVVLRLLNLKQQTLTIPELLLTTTQEELFTSFLKKPQGMLIVTGPTGSGKTTTLYTALNYLNKPDINILSVEDPIEIEMPGINQVQTHAKIDLTFAKILRAFLRQDPDVIMVGEMRDKETADIAIRAAQTGHLVLSSLHTNSACETLSRLYNMGIPSYDIATCVSLIISQRLCRKLCPQCKIKDPLSHYYSAAGCAQCQNGYTSRIAIYEFLPITPKIAQTILNNPNAIALEKIARETGIPTLMEHGLEKVKNGETTLTELYRIMRCES